MKRCGDPSASWLVSCVVAMVTAAACLSGCAHTPGLYGGPGTSPSPDVPWRPPESAISRPDTTRRSPAIPPELVQSIKSWTLTDVIDLALRNSPTTRAAWAAARSAAAAYGSKRGQWLPDINVSGNVGRQQGAAAAGKIIFQQRSYGASADMSWLLFNFGGRKASIEESRQALIAADWSHNAAIQNVVLQAQEAYYQYVTTQALLSAQEATVKEAQTNLNSARERHKAGVATVADELQARTALSQAQLAFEGLQGQIAVTRGLLATAMGLPANTPYDVEIPPLELPADRTMDTVEHYLAQAQAARPELATARAQVMKARAHVRSVKAEGYPSLSAVGSMGRTYYDSPDRYSDVYSLALQLRFPLFTGFSHEYDVLQARADADEAQAQMQSLEQNVTLQVWISYYNLKTANERVKTSDDLLESATESQKVALGRYTAGVGGILDLLAAQAALESARATQVQARADWLLSLARLAHDSGALWTSSKEDKP